MSKENNSDPTNCRCEGTGTYTLSSEEEVDLIEEYRVYMEGFVVYMHETPDSELSAEQVENKEFQMKYGMDMVELIDVALNDNMHAYNTVLEFIKDDSVFFDQYQANLNNEDDEVDSGELN